jgi:hypothetical protein
MDEIDKITLQLLTNKHQYNKYLSKEDPKKFREHQEYLEKIKKYRFKILNLSKHFLENPESCINLEMDEMFSIFAKTAIRYFEMKEIEIQNFYNSSENDEEDETLFGTIDEIEQEENPSKEMNSFWGKSINKTNTIFMNNQKNIK